MDWFASLGLQSLVLFATTVFVVNATPGADMLLTFTQTMRHGARGGLATAAGIASGCLVHTALVVLGVSAMLAASPRAFQALQWLGAGYLVWVAIGLVREGVQPASLHAASDETIARMVVGDAVASTQAAPRGPDLAPPGGAPWWGLLTQGFLTNVLNPKVALFFLALLPQFVAGDAARKTPALLVLGLWFALQGFLFLTAFVHLVVRLRRWQPTPDRRRALHFVAAAALLLVAVRLALTGSGVMP